MLRTADNVHENLSKASDALAPRNPEALITITQQDASLLLGSISVEHRLIVKLSRFRTHPIHVQSLSDLFPASRRA